MRTTRQIPVAFFASLLFPMTIGCGGEKTPPSETAPPVEQTQAEIRDDPSSGTGSPELPDNFPSGFPLPADLEITDARFTAGDSMTQANHLVQGTSRMRVPELEAFYRERLPEAGYSVQPPPPAPNDTNSMIMFSSEEFSNCSVQLRNVEENTNVLISLPLAD